MNEEVKNDVEFITQDVIAPKLKLSKLGEYIKSLDEKKKNIFFDKVCNNDLLWNHQGGYKYRRKRLDNYRYESVSKPDEFRAVLIYVSALYADPRLKIDELFPLIHDDYRSFLKLMIRKSKENNNWNRHDGYQKK